MPKRALKNTVKIQAKGIFVGAHVVRGYDWDWGNQDGKQLLLYFFLIHLLCCLKCFTYLLIYLFNI